MNNHKLFINFCRKIVLISSYGEDSESEEEDLQEVKAYCIFLDCMF